MIGATDVACQALFYEIFSALSRIYGIEFDERYVWD
jgi:hypothetical protein